MGIILRDTASTTTCVRNANDLKAPININNVPITSGDRRLEISDANIPQTRRDLALSICGFVKFDALDNNGGFLPANGTDTRRNLELHRRGWAKEDVLSKKTELTRFFEQLMGNALTAADRDTIRTAVDSMPWPDFDKKTPILSGFMESLSLKFADQLAYAGATGFHIGDRYVVTAGHVVQAIFSELGIYRAVFNMTGNAAQHKVYSIRRVVHSTKPDFSFDKSPVKWIPDIDQAMYLPRTADFAVLELDPRPGVTDPPALPLTPYSPGLNRDVFMIGCPEGLPLKYIDGGKVNRNVSYSEMDRFTATDQGTFTADIDMYGGNSGGPLFDRDLEVVIGTAMGANFETSTIDRIDNDPAARSPLASSINQELQQRFDAAFARQQSLHIAGQPADITLDRALAEGQIYLGGTLQPHKYKPVDLGFSDFFWDLGLCAAPGTNDRSKSHTWSYGRVVSSSTTLRTITFSRVDIIHHLTNSLSAFATPVPPPYVGFPAIGHPGGDIRLSVCVNFTPATGLGPAAATLASSVTVIIGTTNGDVACSTMLGNGPGFTPGNTMLLALSTLAMPGPINPNPVLVNPAAPAPLSPNIMNVPKGLHGWTSIKIRKNTGAIVSAEVCPVDGRASAQFTLNQMDPRALPANRRKFCYKTRLNFAPDRSAPGRDQWIAYIGGYQGGNLKDAWRGPYQQVPDL